MSDTAVPCETLKAWIAKNPNQSYALPKQRDTTMRDLTEGSLSNKTWTSVPVEPATPLSCILYQTDPMYSLTPVSARHSFLREKCTELESSFVGILKGRQWPVRRTAEAIISASTGGSSSCSTLGWKAMAALHQCQIVWFDEGQKLLQFYPQDVHTWTMENPVYFFSNLANQVLQPPSSWSQRGLAKWLSDKEHDGWRVNYEEADGTMEELQTLARDVGAQIVGKLHKAELMKRVGRARALKTLLEWEATS